MLGPLLNVVLPVFAVAAVGFWYAGRRPFPVAAATDLIIHLTGACLVFDALSRADRFGLDTLRTPASAALGMLGTAVLAVLARRIIPSLRSLPLGAVVLPTCFMNAGNLGLPLAELAFGQVGLEQATLVFVTMVLLMYSLGVAVMAGRQGMGQVLRLPLLHAAVAGLVVNQLGLEVPRIVAVPVGLLGRTVVPMMLLALGARLRDLVLDRRLSELPWPPILWLVLLRMGGGGLIAAGVNAMLGNEGVVAAVVFVSGLLPPAVMNFALVEKYGHDPRASALVSGAIAAGAAAALLVLPAGLALVMPPT